MSSSVRSATTVHLSRISFSQKQAAKLYHVRDVVKMKMILFAIEYSHDAQRYFYRPFNYLRLPCYGCFQALTKDDCVYAEIVGVLYASVGCVVASFALGAYRARMRRCVDCDRKEKCGFSKWLQENVIKRDDEREKWWQNFRARAD
jgi:hypothetical protein